MRTKHLNALLLVCSLTLMASPLVAQEHEAPPNLLEPHGGLMIWTLLIFIVLMFVLTRFAFKPLTQAVEAREQALADALAAAKADRDAASKLLADQHAAIDAARSEAQRIIADGRATAEKLRADLAEQAHQQHQDQMERTRREIETEKVRAIADLRREAVDLALAGASKVIERNLDDAQNRRLVESFLASVSTTSPTR